jgi:uncharacterized membrane protein required for colicin V production
LWWGYRRGFSEEWPRLVGWLAIVGLGAELGPRLGILLSRASGWGLAASAALVYLAQTFVVWVILHWLRRLIETRTTVPLDCGRGERVMGSLAGGLWCCAVLVALLAVINSFDMHGVRRQLQASEPESAEALFLTMAVTLQREMLEESFWGRTLRQNAPVLLLKPSPLLVDQRLPSRGGRQQQIDRALSPR